MNNMLSIIIVNYNAGPLTAACIESILKQEIDFKVEIIVIDNHSADDSVSHLRSDWPEIMVLANKENVGLSAGVNQGLAKAKGKYSLNLNPDVIVLSGALQRMVNYMEQNDKVGMSGGQLISPNGAVQDSCYRFYTPMTILYRRTWLGRTVRGKREVARFLMRDYDRIKIRDVDWLMGACLMVRAEAVAKVGGMDERYFLYFEDVDWCRRFWKMHWRISYLPEARFSHYHQRSSEQAGWFGLIFNWIVREHIKSAVKYFWKFRNEPLPHKSR